MGAHVKNPTPAGPLLRTPNLLGHQNPLTGPNSGWPNTPAPIPPVRQFPPAGSHGSTMMASGSSRRRASCSSRRRPPWLLRQIPVARLPPQRGPCPGMTSSTTQPPPRATDKGSRSTASLGSSVLLPESGEGSSPPSPGPPLDPAPLLRAQPCRSHDGSIRLLPSVDPAPPLRAQPRRYTRWIDESDRVSPFLPHDGEEVEPLPPRAAIAQMVKH